MAVGCCVSSQRKGHSDCAPQKRATRQKTVDSIKQFTNNRFTVQSSASNSTDHNALLCHKTITLVTLQLVLLKLALEIKFKYLNAALRDRELVSR